MEGFDKTDTDRNVYTGWNCKNSTVCRRKMDICGLKSQFATRTQNTSANRPTLHRRTVRMRHITIRERWSRKRVLLRIPSTRTENAASMPTSENTANTPVLISCARKSTHSQRIAISRRLYLCSGQCPAKGVDTQSGEARTYICWPVILRCRQPTTTTVISTYIIRHLHPCDVILS